MIRIKLGIGHRCGFVIFVCFLVCCTAGEESGWTAPTGRSGLTVPLGWRVVGRCDHYYVKNYKGDGSRRNRHDILAEKSETGIRGARQRD